MSGAGILTCFQQWHRFCDGLNIQWNRNAKCLVMTQTLCRPDATCLPDERKWYSKYQDTCRRKALMFRRKKKRPGWGWLLIAVIAIDGLLAIAAWFAVGYVVQ